MKFRYKLATYISTIGLAICLPITAVNADTENNYNQINSNSDEQGSKESIENSTDQTNPNSGEQGSKESVENNTDQAKTNSGEQVTSMESKDNIDQINAKSLTQTMSLELQNPNTHPDLISFAYDSEVKKGKIDPSKNSLAVYSKNYRNGFSTFLSMRQLDPTLSYTDWFEKWCNNGASPSGEGYVQKKVEKSNGLTRGCTPSQAANAQRFRNDIRKGDIVLITNGGLGHAAIATSRNYLLEMTGGGNIFDWFGGTLHSNNNQYVIEDWLFPWDWVAKGHPHRNHISENIEIWRLNDSRMAQRVADYADSHYYSTYNGYNKNIHINYQLTIGLGGRNPNYCSKLVFQAFYHGSGSSPVVKRYVANQGWILPYDLKNMFDHNYGYYAYRVGTY